MASYSFDVTAARLYGVNEAIVLQTLIFWIRKNKAEGRNLQEVERFGKTLKRTWTYNSIKTWTTFFPFWSQKQVENILNSLRKQGVLLTGHFENDPMNRRLSYALVEEDRWLEENIQ